VVLANWGGPSGLKISKCDILLQEGLEGGSWELQACQSDLSAGEGYGADHLECHQMACTGQLGDQAQPPGDAYDTHILLDQSDLCLWPGDLLNG